MQPEPSVLRRIRWYFADHGWLWVAFIAPMVVIGPIMLFADGYHANKAARGRAVEQWPEIEASIVSARITEVNASSEYHFGTRLSLSAKFAYQVNSTDVQADYAASWVRQDFKDWSQLLAPGSRIKLRVSPEDRSQDSLWDHNRVP